MPTYVYETIPRDPAAAPVRFEIDQRMSAPALTVHPGTGEPVRRVISGGLGFIGCESTGGTAPAGGCSAPGCGHAH
jgi:predicted nucleic acid-binding Zn ribbon protein